MTPTFVQRWEILADTTCSWCGGDGRCNACDGNGLVEYGNGPEGGMWIPCIGCDGKGLCSECSYGRGLRLHLWLKDDSVLAVSIHPTEERCMVEYNELPRWLTDQWIEQKRREERRGKSEAADRASGLPQE